MKWVVIGNSMDFSVLAVPLEGRVEAGCSLDKPEG